MDYKRLGERIREERLRLLADSVTGGDETILDEFKQIVDNQPLERKLMALQVLRTIFAYFEKEGA